MQSFPAVLVLLALSCSFVFAVDVNTQAFYDAMEVHDAANVPHWCVSRSVEELAVDQFAAADALIDALVSDARTFTKLALSKDDNFGDLATAIQYFNCALLARAVVGLPAPSPEGEPLLYGESKPEPVALKVSDLQAMRAEVEDLLDGAQDSIRNVFPVVPPLVFEEVYSFVASELFDTVDCNEDASEKAIVSLLSALSRTKDAKNRFLIFAPDEPDMQAAARGACVAERGEFACLQDADLVNLAPVGNREEWPNICTSVVEGFPQLPNDVQVVCLFLDNVIDSDANGHPDAVLVSTNLWNKGLISNKGLTYGFCQCRPYCSKLGIYMKTVLLLLAVAAPTILRALDLIPTPVPEADPFHLRHVVGGAGFCLAWSASLMLQSTLMQVVPEVELGTCVCV